VNLSDVEVAEVPAVVVTITSTVPVPAGEEAVIEVALTKTTSVAGVVPKSTMELLVKPVPLIVTLVAPAAGPLSGLTEVTVGTPAGVVVVVVEPAGVVLVVVVFMLVVLVVVVLVVVVLDVFTVSMKAHAPLLPRVSLSLPEIQ
jgi:hypothetical protein